jgi:uncharacterized protein
MTQPVMAGAGTTAPPVTLWRGDKLIYLGWEVMARMVGQIAEQIAGTAFRPTAIVAICRGGLIPATLLSHALGVRTVTTLSIRRNSGDDRYSARHTPTLDEPLLAGPLQRQSILLVDDIVGDGGTMRTALRALESIQPAALRTAALVKNEQAALVPDHFALEVNDWVVFPWEKRQPGEGATG